MKILDGAELHFSPETNLAAVTKSLSDKAKMNPIATYTSAGAVVGAFDCSHWSAQTAFRGGVVGAAPASDSSRIAPRSTESLTA
jgi:hypothetical protein